MASHPRKPHARGFTLIEVMVSLGIMTIGGLAVIALQTQTIRANSHAREITTATQIAQVWIERLKEDAATWTTEATLAGTPAAATVLNDTSYLKDIVTRAGQYTSPPDDGPPVSRGFDYQGNDTNAKAGLAERSFPYYCAAYRLNWVYFGEAMRADVRVWWPRAGGKASYPDFPACGAGMDQSALDPGGSSIEDYHVVYLSTVIRVTPLVR
jgi:prepilin-type N-terminal cleavage/methylation domain-containing protein